MKKWKNEKKKKTKKWRKMMKKKKDEKNWIHTQNHRRFPGFTGVVVTFFVKILDDFHDVVSECVSFTRKINNPFWEVSVFPKKSDHFHWTWNKNTHFTDENQRKKFAEVSPSNNDYSFRIIKQFNNNNDDDDNDNDNDNDDDTRQRRGHTTTTHDDDTTTHDNNDNNDNNDNTTTTTAHQQHNNSTTTATTATTAPTATKQKKPHNHTTTQTQWWAFERSSFVSPFYVRSGLFPNDVSARALQSRVGG